MLLLFVLSIVQPAFAQGAASGESIGAFQRGQAPATPGTQLPGITGGRLSYWELAGLGDAPAPGKLPPTLNGGMPNNPFSVFGPYGIYGQYGVYGPYGMYGPAGPGYGSGLGFSGFGMHDPWLLVKQHELEQAQAVAGDDRSYGQV
jgi:hypothetical protein